MHIFEYLGREISKEKWNKKKAHAFIKPRLEELRLLGTSSNDVGLENIHVSETHKVSLIDFGLLDSSNNDECEKNDFENLDHILGIDSSSDNHSLEIRSMIRNKADTYGKYESE